MLCPSPACLLGDGRTGSPFQPLRTGRRMARLATGREDEAPKSQCRREVHWKIVLPFVELIATLVLLGTARSSSTASRDGL
jgi:hypothetical protein